MSILKPFSIARAVLPFLWIYVSAVLGIWKWITWSTVGMSRPRAAISVASNTEFCVFLNLGICSSVSLLRKIFAAQTVVTDRDA